MKRNKLMRDLRDIANSRGLTLDLVRRGGNHDIYRIGSVQFPVGRHADIPEPTARRIIKEVGEQ
ncbi:type II toxin-antitoxin system HicA family toxin [Nocardia macrotermitis]|uniref:Type II toxin-antitoxin system HicA family toxin n=1 Tax=Nocardia macrotermitis TaxID=2585198 RepID=A0A7K0CW96_9NOCA|nr:type II toxin-antitoxin system HicA family toxin [Nocardia macrotermitis]MQY17765.1 hypothetical protein [Nocardia macrotermitis]